MKAISDIDYTTLPEALRGGVRRWIESGIQPGGLLSAVIANDLRQALLRADPFNLSLIPAIIGWFLDQAPSKCWGSVAEAEGWAARHQRYFRLGKCT
jgi:hypothetical protein